MASRERIARIHIQLHHIKPKVWRRVEVPIGISMRQLHDVIQAALLFSGYHLWEFEVGEKLIKNSTVLRTLIDRHWTALTYTYDLCASWVFDLKVEAVTDADPAVRYPRLIGGKTRTPPEDIIPDENGYAPDFYGDPWYGAPHTGDIGLAEIGERMARMAQGAEQAEGSNSESSAD